MSATAPSPAPPFAPEDLWRETKSGLAAAWRWCLKNPINLLLLAGIAATLGYFYGFYPVFLNGIESTARWTWNAWNEENDLEHGWMILPASLFMVWWHRHELAAAPKKPSWMGLGVVVFGILTFVFAVRTLQGRFAILSFPILAYGTVYFLWGKATARIIFFPCLFLLFMVPMGFLVSRTVALQTLAASVAAKLSGLLGIAVEADGARLKALDGSFQFEVNGGCSGIRSLTAMMMLAALYVHFTQKEVWKQLLIFASSLFFALLGNLARIFSVVLFARFISVKVAAGIYHDWSGFIFFPIAVSSMIAFANLLNRDWKAKLGEWFQEDQPSTPATSNAPSSRTSQPPSTAASPTAPSRPASPISYDY